MGEQTVGEIGLEDDLLPKDKAHECLAMVLCRRAVTTS